MFIYLLFFFCFLVVVVEWGASRASPEFTGQSYRPMGTGSAR